MTDNHKHDSYVQPQHLPGLALLRSDEVLKTTDEICKRLSISRQTLWRLVKANPTMPGKYQIGRSTRWSESELLRWLGTQTKH